jgi:hypothetical protein
LKWKWIGAGDGIRTRDIDLGKVALYQLSYSRPGGNIILAQNTNPVKRCRNAVENKPVIILQEVDFAVLDYCLVGLNGGTGTLVASRGFQPGFPLRKLLS